MKKKRRKIIPLEAPPKEDHTPIVLKKSVFDTKNYYYYFTEVQKDPC
jgi:hypothetical protein